MANFFERLFNIGDEDDEPREVRPKPEKAFEEMTLEEQFSTLMPGAEYEQYMGPMVIPPPGVSPGRLLSLLQQETPSPAEENELEELGIATEDMPSISNAFSTLLTQPAGGSTMGTITTGGGKGPGGLLQQLAAMLGGQKGTGTGIGAVSGVKPQSEQEIVAKSRQPLIGGWWSLLARPTMAGIPQGAQFTAGRPRLGLPGPIAAANLAPGASFLEWMITRHRGQK